MIVKASLENITQVFFKINGFIDRVDTPKLKQMIVEEMIEKGGLPVWQFDKHGGREKILRLSKFGDKVEI